MAFRTICLAVVLSILPIAGCGTISNVVRARPDAGGKVPFGGVKHDLWSMKKTANGEFGFGKQPSADSERYPHLALLIFCAADLPFSLFGDIMTWPYTVVYTYVNQPTPTPPVIIATPDAQSQAPPISAAP